MKVRNSIMAVTDKPGTPENSHTSESQTIPDQTLSLRQLLQRHARGQNITIFQPEYQATDEYDEFNANLRNMPLLDRIDFTRKVQKDAQDTLKQLEAEKKVKDAQQKKIDDQKKAEYEAYVKSLRPNQNGGNGEERTENVKTPLSKDRK